MDDDSIFGCIKLSEVIQIEKLNYNEPSFSVWFFSPNAI